MFKDEFELELNGNTFYVEVEGDASDGIEVTDVKIFDDFGHPVDDTHEYYDDIYNEAVIRDYEVEEHSRDFDYYNHDFNSFLKEDEY
jgi:hypothetical protein